MEKKMEHETETGVIMYWDTQMDSQFGSKSGAAVRFKNQLGRTDSRKKP